jgi:hypothetical protein
MLFLALVAEPPVMYEGKLWTPARLFGWFTFISPIKLSPFEMLCIVLLIVCARKQRAGIARPVVKTIYLSVATVVFSAIYGLSRGGLLQPIYTQTHMWLFALVFALTAMSALTTAADFRRLSDAIVYAAIWRSCTALTFYMMVRGSWPMPQVMTTHDDSVLFVAGILILVSRAIEHRTRRTLNRVFLATPLILLGIVVNNRRLAWSGLAGGMLIVYFMLPAKSVVTRRLNSYLRAASPILAIYVIVGWGRPEPVFKPLSAFASMGSANAGGKFDPSTKARDNENIGMVIMVEQRPLLGTGLGHEFLEVDSSFSVPRSVYPMYYFSPHNSVLAVLAFYGSLGFAGLWLILPLSVYFNARTYRVSQSPVERSVAVTGIVHAWLYFNQAFGDMGLTYLTPAVIAGAGIAASARLVVSSGAWPATSSKRATRRLANSTAG